MQSWLNLLRGCLFWTITLLPTSGPTDHHSVRLPTMVKIILYLVISTPGRVPTSIYSRRDYRPSAIRRQEHICQASLHYSILLFKFNLLPGFTCFTYDLLYSFHLRKSLRRIGFINEIVLGGLSLDQHRTAFSSLYETRTHLFEVAAIETDLGFRNHYT